MPCELIRGDKNMTTVDACADKQDLLTLIKELSNTYILQGLKRAPKLEGNDKAAKRAKA